MWLRHEYGRKESVGSAWLIYEALDAATPKNRVGEAQYFFLKKVVFPLERVLVYPVHAAGRPPKHV
jgi:hypothetical protein